MKLILIVVLMAISGSGFSYPMFPNSEFSFPVFCTVESSDFEEVRYADKVPHCKRRVTQKTKNKVYDLYNIKKEDRGQFTIDHIIPLSIGGANSVYNLWPQHKDIYTGGIETTIYYRIRSGKIRINQAVNKILGIKFGGAR